MPSLPQQQQYHNHYHYQQQQQQNSAATYYNNQQTCVTSSLNNCSTSGSKTTIFLTDNGYLDGNISQQPQSSRVCVLNPSSPILSIKSSPAPIQYSSHYRDKLDLIRDSLKPFEQSNSEIYYCNSAYNVASTSTNYLKNDNVSNGNNNESEFHSNGAEPSEEMRRVMIHALTQGGYDKESAYYALKLVNFTSVIDAAKVLSSIKQNLQNSHNGAQLSHLHQHQQLQPSSAAYTTQLLNVSVNNHLDFNNQNMNIINANALSSNGRAALTRYGVVSDHNLHPTTSTTIVNIGNGSINYIQNKKNSTQQNQHLTTQHQKYQQQQQSPQRSNLNLPNKSHLLNTPSLSVNDFSNNSSSTQSSTYLYSTTEDATFSNNESNKSKSASPVLSNFLADTYSEIRTPSPANRQQQSKRRPRLGGGGYQLSHTQHPHVVLRHTNSFDPAEQCNTIDSVAIRQSRQHQTHSGAVIKIDRIASERIQPSTLNAGVSSNFILPNSSNSMSITTPPTTSITTPLSAPVRQRQDASLFLDYSNEENNYNNLNNQILQLQLKLSNSTPQPYVKSGNPLSLSTTFSSQLQPQQRNTKAHDQTISYNNESTNTRVSIPLSATTNKKLCTNTITSDQTNTVFLSEPTTFQNIFVDSNTSTLDIGINKIIDPPGYNNYINQFVQQSTQATIMNDSVIVSSSILNKADKEIQNQSQIQRCISPLPESISQRLKNKTYERFVKPCKAPMFRFFMEQHIEKLIQQYRERNQRATQLTKEMEAAELAETMKDQMLRLLRQKESKYIRLKRQRMNKNMFDMIRHIGVGAFGKVTLVRKKDTEQIYAMKTLSKEDVIQKQQAAHVKAERDILAEANSNWIVKLFFSFQDSQNLYFIMEYVPGGDMMQLLINKGIFSERLARFYIAELCCAIEYVHSLGFIHRDIKPDNILIDKNGHIKLTDFGLCTGLRWTHDKRHYVIYDDDVPFLNQHLREDSFTLPPHLANSKEKVKLLEYRHHKKRNQAHSVVGTGNYMAPEVIKKIGHTQLCDWWSVGVILYEMVYGRPPFMSHTENPCETQYMIVNWRRFLDLYNAMGSRLSRNCIDIIQQLCCDQEMRLGRSGAKEVKLHSWFKGIDFGNLRSIRSEYIPRVEHAEDTSNFDTFEVNGEELFKTTANENSNTSNDSQPYNPAFFDFTFRHFFASEGIQGAINSGVTNIGGVYRSQQQRPSLAPLIEQTVINNNNNNTDSSNKVKSILNNNINKTIKSNVPSIQSLKNNLSRPISTKKTLAPLAPTQSINTVPNAAATNSAYISKTNTHNHETIEEHE